MSLVFEAFFLADGTGMITHIYLVVVYEGLKQLSMMGELVG